MTPEPSDHGAPAMGEAGRITGVFFEPKKAFADIAARPRWYAPIILIIVVSVVFLYLFGTRVGWERYMRQTMETSTRTQNLTADQKEQQAQTGAKVAPIFGYAGVIIGTPLVALVIGGVMLMMCKMMGAGDSLSFKQTFAISSYSMLPGVISGILAIVVMFLKNPEDFNLQNPLFFNIGAYMEPPPGSGKVLYSLATSFDLFTFWSMLLLAIGLSVAARRFPLSKALTAVVIPWAVWILVKAGWAAAFS